MDREELRNLPLGHQWTPQSLRDHFAAVQGGVAHPGRRRGFAVVAGLCPPRAKGDCEIHVLAEVECPDLGGLFRACRGLEKQHRMAGALRSDPFHWVGDGGHIGARRLMWRLNEETESGYDRDQLSIGSTTILDMPQPYSYMFTTLSDCTREDRKQLYLHGSKVTHAMKEVPRDEVADTRFGEYPAIEALAFVVDALRTWLDGYANESDDRDVDPYRHWKKRSSRFGHRKGHL